MKISKKDIDIIKIIWYNLIDRWLKSLKHKINYIIGVIFMKLGILNTSILTSTGMYELQDITLEQAQDLVHNNDILSAVGHQSTADILTTLLGTTIPMNRIMFEQQEGQKALVFKLLGRPEEGKILTQQEIEQIGYKFQLLIRHK